MEFFHQPSPSNRLGDYLNDNFSGPWTHFRAAVAFVKRSGTRHIATALEAFARIGHVEIIAGIDHHGTSSEGLRDLLNAVLPKGRVIVFHNPLPHTFHPKIYLFKSLTAADVIIGSGNLTEGGLFTNYEAALRLILDLTDPEQAEVLYSIEHVLDKWADLSTGTALALDDLLLAQLTARGLTPLETLVVPKTGDPEYGDDDTRHATDSPFVARAEPRAPPAPRRFPASEASVRATDLPAPASAPKLPTALGRSGFVMTLQKTDVGVGQTKAGTLRRSPEIFIPLAARNANPGFWDWPDRFVSDKGKPGKLDRKGVRMRLGSKTINVNMMTWPDRHDFRLRSEALRSAGNVGDVLRLEKVDAPGDFDYYVEIIPRETSQYPVYLALCRQSVRNSEKKYGYY